MSYWQGQGPRDDRNGNYPNDPTDEANWHDLDVYYCGFGCGKEVERQGECCDQCVVESAMEYNDWDEESLAAQERLNQAKNATR